ncbi:MAG TPA: 2-oxoacid:acceptor oxidoreductase family protein [Desulfohalobiaceae bacterium]|nr:2-oxoacid:acceptor oxidoreductase family protein [Desulfohalobiaceae bacterium]
MTLYYDVIISGFGGQGVLLIGNLLTYTAMDIGLRVTYMPVYGVEMRGGTANCTVVVSNEDIGSPVIHFPKSLIAMNQPSLEKFQPRLLDQGVQIVNSSMVDQSLIENNRIHSYNIPINDLAVQLGNIRLANMVAIGAWIQATQIIDMDKIQSSLEKIIAAHNAHLIPKNQEAIQLGADSIANLQTN